MDPFERKLLLAVVSVLALATLTTVVRYVVGAIGGDFDSFTEWTLAAAGIGDFVIVCLIVLAGVVAAVQYLLVCARSLRTELKRWRK